VPRRMSTPTDRRRPPAEDRPPKTACRRPTAEHRPPTAPRRRPPAEDRTPQLLRRSLRRRLLGTAVLLAGHRPCGSPCRSAPRRREQPRQRHSREAGFV
jgi:hypothetical protein